MTTQSTVLTSQPTPTVTATVWKLDPAHSDILFSVRHMVIAEVTGRFREFEGTLYQRNTDFSESTVEATIRTASIDTSVADRDNHLRSADFFDVEKYPTMTFKSTSLKKIGEDHFELTGDLTIRNVTKPVTLDVRYMGQAVDPWGNLRAGFKATGTIDRYEYGLQWNQALETGGLLVGKTINITLNLQFIKQK